MIIITKRTAAKTSQRQFRRADLPVTIIHTGDLAANTIAVNVVDEEDGAARPLYDSSGVAVVLAETSIPLGIDYPISLQFVKGITTNEVGIEAVMG